MMGLSGSNAATDKDCGSAHQSDSSIAPGKHSYTILF